MATTIGAVLFSAGLARRLQPLSDELPKPLLPILDVPLAAFGLKAVEVAAPILVNVSQQATAIVQGLEPYGRFEVLVEEPEGFGSAGTLAALRDRIAGRALTWNCDIVTDLEPAELMAVHFDAGRPVTIAVRPAEVHADIVVENGKARFVDRRVRDVPGLQFLGAAVIEDHIVRGLPPVRPAGLAEHVLLPCAERGELAVHVHVGYFADVGTFERYHSVTMDLLEGRGPRPPSAFPGEIVRVPGGRAYVGPEAHVEDGSLAPGAVVLARATVDRGARLERTIVMPGSRAQARVHRDEIIYQDETLWSSTVR